MTDDERTDETAQSGPGELPAIPDGGLSETMPEWLRRPPAWRGMVVPEMPEGAAETADDVLATSKSDLPYEHLDGEEPLTSSASTFTSTKPKVLPEPDRSPIDPSALIELSDLPGWLVGLGQREMPVSTATIPALVEPVVSTEVTPPAPDGIALRSQPPEESEPFNEVPAGNGMRILVIAGVIVAVILIAILIAQFG